MTRHKVLITIAALLLFSSARAADVSGTWTAEFDTQVGKQNYTYVLKVSGSQLTGKAKSANGETELKDGKVEGDAVTFVEMLNFQGMELKVTYKGKVVSADEIKFTRDVAGMVQEELVAKRSKPM
jgi:opacity protein-like surface antigen